MRECILFLLIFVSFFTLSCNWFIVLVLPYDSYKGTNLLTFRVGGVVYFFSVTKFYRKKMPLPEWCKKAHFSCKQIWFLFCVKKNSFCFFYLKKLDQIWGKNLTLNYRVNKKVWRMDSRYYYIPSPLLWGDN